MAGAILLLTACATARPAARETSNHCSQPGRACQPAVRDAWGRQRLHRGGMPCLRDCSGLHQQDVREVVATQAEIQKRKRRFAVCLRTVDVAVDGLFLFPEQSGNSLPSMRGGSRSVGEGSRITANNRQKWSGNSVL